MARLGSEHDDDFKTSQRSIAACDESILSDADATIYLR